MVIIRLVRVGRRNQAFFHLVAAEKSKAVQKKYIEKLGYYNPHSDGGKGELTFDEARVKHFVSNGAQMSETAARLLSKQGLKEAGKFIHERPTKPKKTPAPTEAPVKEAQEEVVETPTEETPAEKTEETPMEEKAEEAPAEEVKEAEAPADEAKEEEKKEEEKAE